jgi:hypothetical protein
MLLFMVSAHEFRYYSFGEEQGYDTHFTWMILITAIKQAISAFQKPMS